jgi:hypothetical protein
LLYLKKEFGVEVGLDEDSGAHQAGIRNLEDIRAQRLNREEDNINQKSI